MRRPLMIALASAIALGQPLASAQTRSTAMAMPSPAVSKSGGEAAYGMLVDFTNGFMQVQTDYGSNIITETLATALKRSRDTVRPTSKPIPEEVKKELIPFYPEELLRDVRYVIGDTSAAGLAGFAIRNGNAAAVTLIDTVVFKDESYVKSLALWAHEVHHIQQYSEWGLSGFAARYAFGWADVESAAGDRAKSFVSWYRERKGMN